MHLDEATLNEYLDRRLTAASDRRARHHLGACAECRARLSQLKALNESLETLPEIPLARDLVRPVMARLASRPAPRLLSWLTAVEAVGGTALAAYIWPRLAEWAAPFTQQLGPAAFTLWSEKSYAGLGLGMVAPLDRCAKPGVRRGSLAAIPDHRLAFNLAVRLGLGGRGPGGGRARKRRASAHPGTPTMTLRTIY